ncbi:FAD-binding oxidoreductase [Nocardiopsis sp. NPDC049922]|uniref:FAD-binding oxidoreductase n=1 Tax=Nocardiopsis sp. NPDC049922 TaxID=3155157 RepID=UPI0033FEB542
MTTLDKLPTVVDGRVLLDGDEGFEAARTPWNLAVRQPVAAVVEAADADDVAAVVRFARSAGFTVSAQPSGHGASGNTAGVILLRTGALDEVRVDPRNRTARVGAGATWGRVQAAAGPHGLTGVPGSSPGVSVVGYTLGGGVSWFGRRFGWASDSVTAFEVVDAEGARSRVTAQSDPDLFWALRGGGGDHALVTAMEFDLHPAPELYGGRMVWPGRLAEEVMDAYRRVTATAPRELSTWITRLQVPGQDAMIVVDTAHLGGEAEAKESLRPLEGVGVPLSDSRGPLSPADLGSITSDPVDPAPGVSRAELLTDLDDRAVEVLLDTPVAPMLLVQVRHLGGALAGPSDSPQGPMPEPYALYMFGVPGSPGTAEDVRARQGEFARVLAPSVSGRTPFTLLSPGKTAASAFSPQALERLREVKRDRDPHGVIRSNYPVLG